MASKDAKWYIIQVVSNHEQQVKESLEQRDFLSSDENVVEQVLFPTQTYATKTGKLKRRSMFPGYLFIKLVMTDDAWFIIRNTQFVTGIIGSSGQRTKPTPIPDSQVERILERMTEQNIMSPTSIDKKEKVKKVDFLEGDELVIKEGGFANKKGKVVAISIPKQTVTIEIDFFGRKTPVEIPISSVEKE